MDLAQAFGAILRKQRLKAGLTQEELASACNIERTFVSMLERGERRPSLAMVFAIAKVLKIKASKMVKDTEVILLEE